MACSREPGRPACEHCTINALAAEVKRLRAELAEARRVCESFAARIHAQSELLSRRAESPVRAPRPVGGVVTRALAVPGGVGDFVELVPGGGEPAMGLEVFGGVAIVVGRPGCAARHPARQRRSLLDGEPVQRQVLGVQGDCRLEVTGPITPQ